MMDSLCEPSGKWSTGMVVHLGSVGPKRVISGVDMAAAICRGPVSLVIMIRAPASRGLRAPSVLPSLGREIGLVLDSAMMLSISSDSAGDPLMSTRRR